MTARGGSKPLSLRATGILEDSKGNARKIVANAIFYLSTDPKWSGVLAYDEFAETIVTLKPPPWRPCDSLENTVIGEWSEEDTTRTQAYLSNAFGFDLGDGPTMAAIKVVSAKKRIHPVRDWLESLTWDNTRRCHTWLSDVFGADDTPLTRAIGAAWLVSAVARIYQPGCQVDTVLVLEGDPGIFKSSCLRALVDDKWFFEMAITDVSKVDAMQVLRCKWIAEFPEIDSLTRSEQGHVKAYFSRRVDRYRASYGRKAGDYPRQTIFAASTNKDQWIADETGGTGRRMWPIKCRRGDVALVRAMREQIWAEAVARFKSGERWYLLDPELRDDERAEQDERYRADLWEQQIAGWLQTKPAGGFRSKADLGVTCLDVARGALNFDIHRIGPADASRIAACLRHLGWVQGRREVRDGARVRPYRPIPSPDADDVAPVVPLDTEQEERQDEFPFDAAYEE